MLYGKLVGGVIQYAPPEIYDDNNVVTILNTPGDYYDNGYKRVIRLLPIYDPIKQVLHLEHQEETDSSIIIHYKVVDIDPLQSYNNILEEEVNK